MYLQEINLTQFKNYKESKATFDERINCILGENGMGKTNLLDAIHYLSLGKSAFNSVDRQNIQHECDFLSIRGKFHHKSKSSSIQCSLKLGEKKKISLNKKPYEKLKEHVGRFPIVLISPYDNELINEGNEVRRKFFNNLLSQTDPDYLDDLIAYNRVLNQRNSLLRSSGHSTPDRDLLSTYDHLLCSKGASIHAKRKACLERFLPFFIRHYEDLSDGRETVNINYISDLKSENFSDILASNLERDLILQRTSLGIHRDRYNLTIDEFPAKKFGSQGQQKSLVIALKLAQFEQIKAEKKFKPILLLDDIFDKLDDHRIRRLMQMVSGDFFGQLFITDARPERTLAIFRNIEIPFKIFYIKEGKIEEV